MVSTRPTVEDPVIVLETITIVDRKCDTWSWDLGHLSLGAHRLHMSHLAAPIARPLVIVIRFLQHLVIDLVSWLLPWFNSIDHVTSEMLRVVVNLR